MDICIPGDRSVLLFPPCRNPKTLKPYVKYSHSDSVCVVCAVVQFVLLIYCVYTAHYYVYAAHYQMHTCCKSVSDSHILCERCVCAPRARHDAPTVSPPVPVPYPQPGGVRVPCVGADLLVSVYCAVRSMVRSAVVLCVWCGKTDVLYMLYRC